MTETLEFAVKLARQAGELLLGHFTLSGTHAHLKEDRSVVTEADIAADRLIANAIHSTYPEDGLLSEELYNVSPLEKKAVWVIDPLDGTTNFSLGLPIWGISIARLVDGFPALGVLYFPTLGELYTAQSGLGASLNGTPIHAAGSPSNPTATFFACCSRTHRRYQINIPYKTRILGSAAYNLCAVARGMAIVGFEATVKLWDIAAGWLLIHEAGGVIETFEGQQPFPLSAGKDYSRQSFPVLSGATTELVALARSQIIPK